MCKITYERKLFFNIFCFPKIRGRAPPLGSAPAEYDKHKVVLMDTWAGARISFFWFQLSIVFCTNGLTAVKSTVLRGARMPVYVWEKGISAAWPIYKATTIDAASAAAAAAAIVASQRPAERCIVLSTHWHIQAVRITHISVRYPSAVTRTYFPK